MNVPARKPYLCIPLKGKYAGTAYISEWAWPLVDGITWYRTKNGYAHSVKYGLMHRRLMAAEKGEVIDHHNFNRLDNRYENIKCCLASENKKRVSRKRTPWPYKGVRQIYQKWTARITVGGRSVHLGYFKSAEEAAAAFDHAAKPLGRATNFGEQK
jgi:hypothetical protein